MALPLSEVRRITEQACARQDVLDALARRDLGTVVAILGAHGLTQEQIGSLTGTSQGRLSEWTNGKRKPRATSTFEKFADGLALPPAARRALGLAGEPPGTTGVSLARRPRDAAGCDAGLEYPATPLQAAANVSALWHADLDDQSVLERGLVTPSAWTEASLRWLIAPADSPRHDDAPGGVRVGAGDVERFRDTVEMFRELDDRFGGGHARDALIRYLQGDAVRLLRGRYPDTVGSALLTAVAEATMLAAWMTYDSTPHTPQAQRYFIQALGLAQAEGDRRLGARRLVYPYVPGTRQSRVHAA